jgi:hypothetical protein
VIANDSAKSGPSEPEPAVIDDSAKSDDSTAGHIDDPELAAKQKRARVDTFNFYFTEPNADIQQQWIETTRPG